MMVVLITNVTDAPGKNPTHVDVYNKTLSPGAQIRIPIDLVTKKIRTLEDRGLVAIGNLPPWYVTAQRRSKPLTEEEKQKRQVTPPPEPIPLRPDKPDKLEKKEIDRELIAKKG
jgi:hypothetical protein